MSDEQLGIPEGTAVHSGSARLPEGWTLDWTGVRIASPPSWPPPWPYRVLTTGDRLSLLIQVWSQTLHRPGFVYNVRWHPELGRTYTANGSDPGTLPQLVRDAQRVLRREMRGRLRKRPAPEQYVSDAKRIERGQGIPPTRERMADEYGVQRSTVARWLQRPEWRAAVPDKYRSQ